METVDTDVFWSRVVDAPDCFGELQATDAAWHERAVVVWRVVGETLVQREGNDMLVAAWENNLGLAASDGAEPGARKVALLNHMCSEGLPVPAGLLESVLTRMLGEGRARVKHSGDTLTVSVALDTTEEQIAEVQKMLDRVLPRNLVTEMEWIDGLPMTYTRLAYIERTHNTWLNLGVAPQEDFVVTIDFDFVQYGSYSSCGFWDTSGTKRRFFLDFVSGKARFSWGLWVEKWVYELGPNKKYRLVVRQGLIDYTNLTSGTNKKTEFEYGSLASLTPEELGTIMLFYDSQAVTDYRYDVSSFVISDAERTIINLIPALDTTGAPCMFDLVTKTPFYNSGTGDFLYPGKEEEATTYSLRNRMYAKYTEHGIRRLYRVPKGYNSKEEYAEKHGFKILVETPMPEEGYWAPVWHEREDCIELEWVETEAPEEGLEP